MSIPKKGEPEGELDRLRTHFEAVLESLDDAVTIVDQEGRVTYWNRAAEKMYGIERASIAGRPISDFFAPASLMVTRVLQTRTPVENVYHQPRPDKHVLVTAVPVISANQALGALSVERDMTRLVELNRDLVSARHDATRAAASRPGDPFDRIRGRSLELRQAVEVARAAAPTAATVLIRGESGVGKEVFAQAIHLAGQHPKGPFIALNCGAIPPTLFESELFGYEGGAFTGADPKGHQGKIELAHGGTLFLDEVGDLPLELQVKMLRVLEEGRFYRIGGRRPVTVDFRLIAATNRPLEKQIEAGTFRADLYWRLNVISLEIPPLRRRPEDIAEMAELFFREYSIRHNRPVRAIGPGVMESLLAHSWPGNVRELRNLIERLVVLAPGGEIRVEHLPETMIGQTKEGRPPGRIAAVQPAAPGNAVGAVKAASPLNSSNSPSLNASPSLDTSPSLDAAVREASRAIILDALRKCGGNKSRAAKLLGISRGTLYARLRESSHVE